MNSANDNAAETRWSHIELSSGTITASTVEGAEGVRQNVSDIGKFKFFIDAVEVGGGRLGLNSCEEYETAVRSAEEARVGFEIDFPVKDNVAGSH